MRNIQINIDARPGTQDNHFSFSSQNTTPDPLILTQNNVVYQFISASIGYSVQSSGVTGTVKFGMSEAVNSTNIIRSGQLIQIYDNGNRIFEGIILFPQYQVAPVDESGQGNIYFVATIAPSIYQFTTTPMVFDSAQVQQINTLLNTNLTLALVGNVAQEIDTQKLLAYMISNTDYSTSYQKNIQAQGLPANVFLMVSAGDSRDSVLRASIDFTNTVLYQQEDGTIIIRQLDSRIKAPFSLDLTNGSYGQPVSGAIAMLQYTYKDNAASTPSIVSNYALIPSNLGVAADVSDLYVSYTPNPVFYPRIQQLQKTGWFVGSIINSQINTNIVSDPTLQAIVEGYAAQPDKYMISSEQSGAKENFVASYQALLTGKQLGQALTSYASLECTVSMDDVNFPEEGAGSILGTCVDIQNCDMQAGLIASYSRLYSAAGNYISLSIVPLGSITGYWVA